MKSFTHSLKAKPDLEYPKEWLLTNEERITAKAQTLKTIAEYAAFSARKEAENK